ncbi:probable disease resistance protein At5g45490 [Vitis riparia]|uniref:probable disease resistance protein At5g45490 n=1 Tax=Vitis riparia TaxID=96939 RepID=UPI00155A53CC|nr:probable disease resistance protein At5g45490 [Vitis riparia]
MSADHLQFLKNKFILDLEDAEEEHSGENEIPLLAHFLQIRDALKAKDITASTPIRLKNCLYNAISALEECVVLSEKREPRKKKDGPMHGYTLAEHWILCKTRKLLVQVKRKLTAPADAIIPGMTDMAGSSSSTSLPLIPRPNPENSKYRSVSGFDEQLNTISDRLRKTGEGFQEIGIVGIGGSGKTALAQLVFTQSDERYFRDYRIWICLFRKLSGNVRFKKMIKDMLKQCKAVGDYEDFDEEEQSEEAAAVDDEDYDGVEVEELLENLGKALKGKRYLMVLDGIWDINIHWYFKLKEKLKSLTGDGDGHVIITSRLPHKARMMVGPHNLYHMQPPLESMEDMWQFELILGRLKRYKLKLKDEAVEQCDGLPLAMHTLAAVIEDQILGDRNLFWSGPVLVNLEDDPILGNELLLSWRTLSLREEWVWF